MNKPLKIKIFCLIALAGLGFMSPLFSQTGGDPMGDNDSLDYTHTRALETIPETDKPEIPLPPDVMLKETTEGLQFEKKEVQAPTEYQPPAPRIKSPGKEVWPKLYNNYVKLGFGRFMTPVGKLYLHNGRHDNLDFGLDFTHISAHAGHEKYAEFREDYGSANFNYYLKNHTFGTRLYVNNTNFFYYADSIVEGKPDLKDSIRQNYTKLQADVYLLKNYDPKGIGYDVKLRFRDYFDRFGNNDLHVSALPEFKWKISDLFGAEITSNLTFSNARFDSITQSRIFFDIAPVATFEYEMIRARAGLRINSYTDSTNQFGAFPYARVEADILPEYLTVYGGIQGEMKYNQFYDLIDQNRYLDTQMPDIRPTRERFNINAGFTGSFAKYFTWNLSGWYRSVSNQMIFFTPEEGSRFQMVYDSAFKETGGQIGLQFNMNDKIRAGVRGSFKSFNLNNVAYNFQVPNTQFDLWASYNFADKFYASAEVYVFGTRVMSLDSAGEALKQNAMADVNLALEYRFSKRISIFLAMNNLINNNYYRWHNYREREFDVKGGFTLSF